MNTPFDHTCEQCHFFRKGDALTGNCHRFPPVFAGDSSPRETHHWRYPTVGIHGWCGEFLPLPTLQIASSGIGI